MFSNSEFYKNNFSDEEYSHLLAVKNTVRDMVFFIEEYKDKIDSIDFNFYAKNVSFVLGEKLRLTLFPFITINPKPGLLCHVELTKSCYSCFNKDESGRKLDPYVMGLRDKSDIKFTLVPDSNGLELLSKFLLGEIYTKLQTLNLENELSCNLVNKRKTNKI